jgi:hypothetical protein
MDASTRHMLNHMKHFNVKPNEYVSKITDVSLTDLQTNNQCDFCGKDMTKDTRVLGKIVVLKQGTIDRARFSPTCLQCVDMN